MDCMTQEDIFPFFKRLLAGCIPDMPERLWVLQSDTHLPLYVTVAGLELFTLHDGKKHMLGKTIVEGAMQHGILLGQTHAHSLWADSASLPEAWKKYHIIFPGTIWQTSYANYHLRVMPHLAWDELKCGWVLGFTPVDVLLSDKVCVLGARRSKYRTV